MIQKNEIPILEYDTESPEIIPPNKGAEHLHLPEKCVFAFVSDTINQYAKEHNAEIIEYFETTTKTFPIYIVKENNETYTLAQAPLGASASAQFLDTLIACGCKKIISTGSCGVLINIEENEFLIPVKALRDEGTSYQYLPAERYITLDQQMQNAIRSTMDQHNIPHTDCIAWTTDGFFRETIDMVNYRKEEGCSCVEMECAALAACAKKRNAQFGQFFFTADSLANLEHDERGWGKNSLENALQICVDIIHNL